MNKTIYPSQNQAEPSHTTPAKKQRKRLSWLTVVRALVQLAAFLLMPGLFLSIFGSLGNLYRSVLAGSFNIAEQSMDIILTAAAFIVTFLWGRFFCGFICSFGAMQDLLWAGGRHFPKKLHVPEKADRVLKYLKYVVLLLIVIGVWTFSVTGATLWSPWTIFGMYATVKGFPSPEFLISIGGLLMLMILIGSLFIERFFCKYLCPLGGLFSLVARFRIFRIKKPSASCGSCRLCTKQCSMSIPLYQYDSVSSGECINCMKCMAACPRKNVQASPVPAVSGTVAAAALMGVSFFGGLSQQESSSGSSLSESRISQLRESNQGGYRDGTYQGTGTGYRGSVEVTVTVSGGFITEITVNSYNDDREFFEKAKSGVLDKILDSQSTSVDAVSGATFSSRGLIEAVRNALGDQLSAEDAQASLPKSSDQGNSGKKGGKNRRQPSMSAEEQESSVTTEESSREEEYSAEESSQAEQSSAEESSSTQNDSLADGVYTGSGIGYRGTTTVSVTVSGGRITDITVTSYQDDDRFFSRAQSSIISEILSSQSTDVSTVSGATFSSNGLIEAVSNALSVEFVNPNSSMGGRHGR